MELRKQICNKRLQRNRSIRYFLCKATREFLNRRLESINTIFFMQSHERISQPKIALFFSGPIYLLQSLIVSTTPPYNFHRLPLSLLPISRFTYLPSSFFPSRPSSLVFSLAMPSKHSFFNTFLSLFLLLFMGCFLFPAKTPPTKKRKPSRPSPSPSPPSPSKTRPGLSFLNPWAYLKPIFSFKSRRGQSKRSAVPPPPLSAVSRKRSFSSSHEPELSSDSLPNRSSFTIRSDIFPCPTCGEIFHRTQNLEVHQSTKHAISELRDGDTAANIVRIIFQTGWTNPKDKSRLQLPKIHRILKIHSSPKTLARFEEYRESVKIESSRKSGIRWNERCTVDGNELLRFQCSTFTCSLGEEGNSGICAGELCSVCGIIRSGFSAKLDGISTMGSSRRAHESIPEEMEEGRAYMKVRRAMLVCRVVAARVAREGDAAAGSEKGSGGFDSLLVCHQGGGTHKGRPDGEEELLVFNPKAVLPCFAVVYSV